MPSSWSRTTPTTPSSPSSRSPAMASRDVSPTSPTACRRSTTCSAATSSPTARAATRQAPLDRSGLRQPIEASLVDDELFRKIEPVRDRRNGRARRQLARHELSVRDVALPGKEVIELVVDHDDLRRVVVPGRRPLVEARHALPPRRHDVRATRHATDGRPAGDPRRDLELDRPAHAPRGGTRITVRTWRR